MAPLQQPTTSLVGVSDMHMNLKQEVFYNSIRVQEGQAQNSSTHIKKYKHDSTKVNKKNPDPNDRMIFHNQLQVNCHVQEAGLQELPGGIVN